MGVPSAIEIALATASGESCGRAYATRVDEPTRLQMATMRAFVRAPLLHGKIIPPPENSLFVIGRPDDVNNVLAAPQGLFDTDLIYATPHGFVRGFHNPIRTDAMLLPHRATSCRHLQLASVALAVHEDEVVIVN